MYLFNAGSITKLSNGEIRNCSATEIFVNRRAALNQMLISLWGMDRDTQITLGGEVFAEENGKKLSSSRSMQVSNEINVHNHRENLSGKDLVVAAFFGKDQVDAGYNFKEGDNKDVKLRIFLPKDNKPHYLTYDRKDNVYQVQEEAIEAPELAPKPGFLDRIKAFFGRNVESVNRYNDSKKQLEAYNDFCQQGIKHKEELDKKKANIAARIKKQKQNEKSLDITAKNTRTKEKSPSELQSQTTGKQKTVKGTTVSKEKTNVSKAKTSQKNSIKKQTSKTKPSFNVPKKPLKYLNTRYEDMRIESFRQDVLKTVKTRSELKEIGDTAVMAMRLLRDREINGFTHVLKEYREKRQSEIYNCMAIVTAYNMMAEDPELSSKYDPKDLGRRVMNNKHFEELTGFGSNSKRTNDEYNMDYLSQFLKSKGLNVKESFPEVYEDMGLTYPDKKLDNPTLKRNSAGPTL